MTQGGRRQTAPSVEQTRKTSFCSSQVALGLQPLHNRRPDQALLCLADVILRQRLYERLLSDQDWLVPLDLFDDCID